MSNWQIALDNSPASIEVAKQTSHDNVIRSAGDDRLSGVMWTFWSTDDAPHLQGEGGVIEVDADTAALCRMFPGRTLVMATVAVRPL